MKKILCMVVLLIICSIVFSQSVMEMNGYTWDRLSSSQKQSVILGWYMCATSIGLYLTELGKGIASVDSIPENYKQVMGFILKDFGYNLFFIKKGETSLAEYTVGEIVTAVDYYYMINSPYDTINKAIMVATKKDKDFVEMYSMIESNYLKNKK